MARIAGKLLSDSTGGMMLRVLVVLLMLLVSPLAAAERVVSLGGSVTEIVYALGEGDRLVADDASSIYPEAATQLPRVGYYRNLSLEGILSQRPDLLIASENAGPPEVLERLRAMCVPTVAVSDSPGVESLLERVREVANALEVPAAGETLRARIQSSLEAVKAAEAQPRRALVVLLSNLRDEDDQQLPLAAAQIARRHRLLIASLREEVLDRQRRQPVENYHDALSYCGTVDYAAARTRLHERFAAQGLPVLDVRPAELGPELVNRYLQWKAAGTL